VILLLLEAAIVVAGLAGLFYGTRAAVRAALRHRRQRELTKRRRIAELEEENRRLDDLLDRRAR
jgi:hypothetical protein